MELFLDAGGYKMREFSVIIEKDEDGNLLQHARPINRISDPNCTSNYYI